VPHRTISELSLRRHVVELSKLGNQHWRPIFDFHRSADVARERSGE